MRKYISIILCIGMLMSSIAAAAEDENDSTVPAMSVAVIDTGVVVDETNTASFKGWG